MDVTIKLNSVSKILAERGLNADGKTQRFLTTEVARLSNPYVPWKSGNLKDTQVEIKPTQIKYYAPYAQKQYYENAGMGKQGLHRGGMRGKLWIPRMMADRGDELIESVAKMAGGRAK
ncbi:minor capsid protein [Clostridium perfringens]